MVYEAWVAPSFEAAGCMAPRFCGLGTDRSPLIIDAARDATAEFSATSLANVPADLLEAFFKELPAPAPALAPRTDGLEVPNPNPNPDPNPKVTLNLTLTLTLTLT